MSLASGARIGRYEILAVLGAGGMGEVYRARDPKLSRDVAIKVLPASFTADPDRLQRFEQEARAAGALNHPNILVIHDVDTHEGAPFLVSELLEGETLRARLGGVAAAPRRAIDYAIQAAQGLAAAHDKGIVHRDLKPENLFITSEGRVKILDFGLAKLTQPEAPGASQTESPTLAAGTGPGVVLGTAGYMAPEQVRARPSDHRADIFAFGAILYEMLSGRRAFQGETAADTMTAILKEDPPELSSLKAGIAPGLERIVRHCLEKHPEARFQSARDLAFDLEALSTSTAGGTPPATAPGRRGLQLAVAGMAAVALATGLFYAGRRSVTPAKSLPTFKQLTYGRGNVMSARFAPDGKSVVYSAAWIGQPQGLFLTIPGSPESRALGVPGDLLAVSASGELALEINKRYEAIAGDTGMLARMPLAGGAPREVLDRVTGADWAADGQSLAVVRDMGSSNRLEFPIGTLLYETPAGLFNPRISPSGEWIAVLEQGTTNFDPSSNLSNTLVVVDRTGKKKRALARILNWNGNAGIAWSAAGTEVLTPGTSESGSDGYLFATDLEGRQRAMLQTPGNLTLHDIASDGRVLIEQDLWRNGIVARAPGQAREVDLTWLMVSSIADISADGRLVLFTETSAGAGQGAVYIRGTDASPAVRLGEGTGCALSPDGRLALAFPRRTPTRFTVLPTGAGQARTLGDHGLAYVGAAWLPDGKRFVSYGYEPGHRPRVYVEDLEGSAPRAITPEGLAGFPALSPDGRRIAAPMAGGEFLTYTVEGGEPKAIPGLDPGDSIAGWSSDGRWLYGYRLGPLPTPVFRVEIATGRREPWLALLPADASGVMQISRVAVSPDGKSYAYNYTRVLYSNLFLLEGLK